MNHSIKYISVIAFILLIFSCKSLPDNPPIAMDKMSKIILDIQIAEIHSQGLGDSVKNKFEKNYDSLDAFYVSILKHYAISYNDFDNAMEWYKNHPVLMDSVLGMVGKELTSVKTKEHIKEALTPPEAVNATTQKQKTDSIKKADSLKVKAPKDTVTSDKKSKSQPAKGKTLDSTHKKPVFLKREP